MIQYQKGAIKLKKLILLLSLACVLLSGCIKRDSMEDITIYTTIYPLEYITSRLYGDYSTIYSIYPRGVNVQLENCENCGLYTLTDTLLSNYSQADLLIFNSLLYEGNYVKPMAENNKDLKIINAADHLTTEYLDELYGLEELWLDPSRLSTLARNIKNGFNEFINNYYLKNHINDNFDQLKEDLDKLESKISELTKKADNKVIVVADDVFKFLEREKYGLTVYSLDEGATTKTIDTVKDLIKEGKIKYIYIKQYEDANDTVTKLIKGTKVELIPLNTLTNLTETELNNKKDYFSIMNENIELLKKGLYN